MSDGRPIISLRDVEMTYRVRKQVFSKQKRQVNALKGISFDIFAGEKLGIVGRNGCGKSTLFKILAGIFEPDEGTVEFVPGLNVQLLSLGVGFEGNLSGRENAVLNGMLLGKSRAYMKQRADAIRDFSELGEFFEMPVYTYSSGMNARLGFSVALEASPDVLLIDEVLGVGDAHFAEKSEKAMMDRFDSGATIILVTHNEFTIRKLCDRAVWIEDGLVRKVGETDAVADAYLESLQLAEKRSGSSEPTPPGGHPVWQGPSVATPGGGVPGGPEGVGDVAPFYGIRSLRVTAGFSREWVSVNVWDCEKGEWVFEEHRSVFDLSEMNLRDLPANRWFGISVWSFAESRWHGLYVCLRGRGDSLEEEISLVTLTGDRAEEKGLGKRVSLNLATGGHSGKGWFVPRCWSSTENSWDSDESEVFEPDEALFGKVEASAWHWTGLWSYHEERWAAGSWVGLFPFEEGE